MNYERAQVYVEIVIYAIAHDSLGIEPGGVGGVDLLAVHPEADFPTSHHDAQLVRGLAARVGLHDGVALGPALSHFRCRVARDAALHEELAVAPHQEVSVAVLGVGEMAAADEQAVRLRVVRVLGLRERRDHAVVARCQVPGPPQNDGRTERHVDAAPHRRDLRVGERLVLVGSRVPPGRAGPAPADLPIRIMALSGGWGDPADVHQARDDGSRQWDDAHSLTYPPAPGKGLDCPRISATMGI